MLTYFTPCAGVYIVSFEQVNAGLEKYHCRLCEVSISKIAFHWLILFVDSNVSYEFAFKNYFVKSESYQDANISYCVGWGEWLLGSELWHFCIIVSMILQFPQYFSLHFRFGMSLEVCALSFLIKLIFLPYKVKKVITSDYSITSKLLSSIQCPTYGEFDSISWECPIFIISSFLFLLTTL